MEELKEIRDLALKNVGEMIAQNKEEVIKAYRLVTSMAYRCQKGGIFALEYAVDFLPKDTLLLEEITEMVRLVIDGKDPQLISEMLTLKFLVNQYCGLEAFLYYLYARSLLLIQSGASPYVIESFFNFALPERALFFDEQRSIQKENNLKKLVSGSGFSDFEIILPFLDQETQDLAVAYMNPYRYQEIINWPRAVQEQNTLAIALKGVREEIRECFYRNMTIRVKYCLQEDMEYMGPVRLCDVEAAQRSILQTAKRKGLFEN